MRVLILVLLSILLCSSANAYERETVLAAQEALVRLGYDPGPPDGAWGGKTRIAMNALREANGLPPAQDFTGSSLALIHRLSPGATTLPHPGLFITDVKARAEVLKTNYAQRLQCPVEVGLGIPLRMAEPIPEITTTSGSKGYIGADEDWYSPILEGLVGAQGGCLAGQQAQCSAIVDMAVSWADSDAIRPGVARGNRAFEDVHWIGNTLLRNLTIAYGVARQFVDVDPVKEAVVLDWLKRRLDDYHYIMPHHEPIGDRHNPATGNHGLAHMMPALTFGVLVGDRSLMEPAFKIWRDTLQSLRKDGSIPTETQRGARWAHYTSISISQLLTVAELAQGQDIDLYATSTHEGKSIQHAVEFWVAALQDFDLAAPYAKAMEGPGPSDDYKIPELKSGSYAWLPAYQAQFGDDQNIERMKTAVLDPRFCSAEAVEEEKLQSPDPVCHGPETVLPMAATLLAMRPEPSGHMAYPAGCLQGAKPWPLEVAVADETTDFDFSTLPVTERFDGAACTFTIYRQRNNLKEAEPIASGKLKFDGARLVVTRGTWSTGGAATPESFAGDNLAVTESGKIVGKMTMFAENAMIGEGTNLGTIVDMKNSWGTLDGDLPDGEIGFRVDAVTYGRLDVYLCERKPG